MAPAEHTTNTPSPWDMAMSDIAAERWGFYQSRIRPVEKQYKRQIDALGTPGKLDAASGLATAGVMGQAMPQLRQAKTDAFTKGVNPGSGQFVMNAAESGRQLAGTLSDADFQARMGQKNRYYQGLENYVGLGNLQAGNAIGSLSDVAGRAQQQAMSNSAMAAEEDQAMGQGFGTAVGLGLGAYGMHGR